MDNLKKSIVQLLDDVYNLIDSLNSIDSRYVDYPLTIEQLDEIHERCSKLEHLRKEIPIENEGE